LEPPSFLRRAVTVMSSLAESIDQAGLIDKRPAAIARCHGVADIVDAVKLARTLDLDVAVRGGGHNVAGHATLDHGLLIDLSPMKGGTA
jgi:FAD/FMN-containing dehydrogenase